MDYRLPIILGLKFISTSSCDNHFLAYIFLVQGKGQQW